MAAKVELTRNESGSFGLMIRDDCTVEGYSAAVIPAATLGSMIVGLNGRPAETKAALVEQLLAEARGQSLSDQHIDGVIPIGADRKLRAQAGEASATFHLASPDQYQGLLEMGFGYACGRAAAPPSYDVPTTEGLDLGGWRE